MYAAALFMLVSALFFIPLQQEMPVSGAVEAAAAQITAPKAAAAADYNLPKNRTAAAEAEIEAQTDREKTGEQYLLYRFLVGAFLILLALCAVARIAVWRFERYKTTLWKPVIYIHKSDGKKKIAFCNE